MARTVTGPVLKVPVNASASSPCASSPCLLSSAHLVAAVALASALFIASTAVLTRTRSQISTVVPLMSSLYATYVWATLHYTIFVLAARFRILACPESASSL